MTTILLIRKAALFLSWAITCGIAGDALAGVAHAVTHIDTNYMLVSMACAIISAMTTVSFVSRGMDRLNMSNM